MNVPRLAKEAYDAHVGSSIEAPCWAMLDREEQRRWCKVVKAVLRQLEPPEDAAE